MPEWNDQKQEMEERIRDAKRKKKPNRGK